MRAPVLILVAALGVLAISFGAESPVAALTASDATAPLSGIRSVQRKTARTELEPVEVRDPFVLPDISPSTAAIESPIPAPRMAGPATPAFPVFKILGKQEDDEGWAVFLSSPDLQGQVWVVREGETFAQHYQVSKLAPPLLILSDSRSRKRKSFNIGKDEE